MKKTVIICDSCGSQIEDKTPSTIIVRFGGSRREIHADVCDACVGGFSFIQHGTTKTRAGRKPAVGA